MPTQTWSYFADADSFCRVATSSYDGADLKTLLLVARVRDAQFVRRVVERLDLSQDTIAHMAGDAVLARNEGTTHVLMRYIRGVGRHALLEAATVAEVEAAEGLEDIQITLEDTEHIFCKASQLYFNNSAAYDDFMVALLKNRAFLGYLVDRPYDVGGLYSLFRLATRGGWRACAILARAGARIDLPATRKFLFYA